MPIRMLIACPVVIPVAQQLACDLRERDRGGGRCPSSAALALAHAPARPLALAHAQQGHHQAKPTTLDPSSAHSRLAGMAPPPTLSTIAPPSRRDTRCQRCGWIDGRWLAGCQVGPGGPSERSGLQTGLAGRRRRLLVQAGWPVLAWPERASCMKARQAGPACLPLPPFHMPAACSSYSVPRFRDEAAGTQAGGSPAQRSAAR
ncbi:uncharacterized protein PSFLO_06962 [Pseudozyma flocculosa]|uniref:Uncharacterized protein n=1 Tax=Pseudozyma flocculosa TaxID=84751 RepID=A0A5C3FB54_9BASI|nr:uncharacterized protein PSFLO_06962 [Pseudozyma flocculosa]